MSAKLKCRQNLRDVAHSKYQTYLECAKQDLYWARKDRERGHRDDHLQCLQWAAHNREKAMKWYAKYLKACRKVAELSEEVA